MRKKLASVLLLAFVMLCSCGVSVSDLNVENALNDDVQIDKGWYDGVEYGPVYWECYRAIPSFRSRMCAEMVENGWEMVTNFSGLFKDELYPYDGTIPTAVEKECFEVAVVGTFEGIDNVPVYAVLSAVFDKDRVEGEICDIRYYSANGTEWIPPESGKIYSAYNLEMWKEIYKKDLGLPENLIEAANKFAYEASSERWENVQIKSDVSEGNSFVVTGTATGMNESNVALTAVINVNDEYPEGDIVKTEYFSYNGEKYIPDSGFGILDAYSLEIWKNLFLENEPIYKIVTPTEKEIEELAERFSVVFSECSSNYDCETDNAYERMWDLWDIDYVCPEYLNEIKQYVATPFVKREYAYSSSWEKFEYEEDPLGYFDEIPSECYDENGVVQMDLVYKYRDEINDQKTFVIGYNKISAPFLDWLIEGVWNGKVNHDTLMELEETKCYYHNGFYYTPILTIDRGGGVFWCSNVHSITDMGNGKFKVVYSVGFDDGEILYNCTAEMALKESKDGFRFWSIYKMTCEDA